MYELSEHDPMVEQPEGLKISLKPHQRTLVHRCIMLEQGKSISTTYQIYTKMGVICDKVGAGKSYSLLSLLLLNNEIATYNETHRINTFASIVVPEIIDDVKCFKTNILVVPSPIISQWITYLNNTTLKYQYIDNQKRLNAYFIDIDPGDGETFDMSDHFNKLHNTDVLLIGSKLYGQWRNMAYEFGYSSCLFLRMIIDESVNIHLPDNKSVNARFYWFMTASWDTTHIKNRGFIKQLWYFSGRRDVLFIKNDDKFVDLSMGLFESNIVNIVSDMTKSEQILTGFVEPNIIKSISATTEQYAAELYHTEHSTFLESAELSDVSEESHRRVAMSIVNTIASDMYQKIHNYKVKISAINEMQLTKKQKTDRIGKINEKIEVLVDRIKKLQTRISECNVDPVTLEDIDNPVITECCKQLFNESTIEELCKLNTNVQCPMCRHQLSVIKVVPAISIMPDALTPKTTLTRLENFKNVVSSIYAKTGLNTKLLIFSEYNKTFELVDNVLKQFPMIYSKYISDAKLLDRYKKRNVNILLLNARSHSAGLNLENTTDIIIYHEMTPEMETQIIGRANRLGRTIGPLNVWKFV